MICQLAYLYRLCKRLSVYTTSCAKSPYSSASAVISPLIVMAVSNGHCKVFSFSSELTWARSWALIKLDRTPLILQKNKVKNTKSLTAQYMRHHYTAFKNRVFSLVEVRTVKMDNEPKSTNIAVRFVYNFAEMILLDPISISSSLKHCFKNIFLHTKNFTQTRDLRNIADFSEIFTSSLSLRFCRKTSKCFRKFRPLPSL